MRELSDEEVFGAAPVAARELSDAEVFGAPPAPPSLDQQQAEYEQQNPFFERVGQRLSRGYNQAIAGEHTRNAADLSGALMELAADPSADPAHIAETQQALIASISNMARNQSEIAKSPVAPVARAAGEAKDWGSYFDAVKTAPVSYIADVGLPSLVQSAPAISDFIMGGRVGGKRGGMAGGGAGSAGVDYAAELSGALTKAGVDMTNPEAIKTALSDPAFLEKAKKEAGLHAGVVGLFDALSFGLASKVMAPAKASPIAREITNLLVQAPVQGTLGAAGEAGGQLAAGQELSPGEIGGEFFGEMFTAPADVAGAALSGTRDKVPVASPAPVPVEPPKALPAPRMITLPDGQLVSETDLENMPIADRIRAQAGGVAPAPEPAPQPVAGLLTQQDPDPMVAFPDGSTARKSEVDAMVAKMPIEERARLFNLGQETAPAPTPIAADVVAQNTVPERSPIAEVIARNVGIRQAPEVADTRARARDVRAATDEQVGVTVDPVTQQERPLTAAEYYRRYYGIPAEPTINKVSKSGKVVVAPTAAPAAALKAEIAPTVNKAQEIDQTVKTSPVVARKQEIAPQEGEIAPNAKEAISVSALAAESTPAGTNNAGEALYDNKRGRFRVRHDRADQEPDGYTDFGGDLAPVKSDQPVQQIDTSTERVQAENVDKKSSEPRSAAPVAESQAPSTSEQGDGEVATAQASAAPDVPKMGTTEPNVGTTEKSSPAPSDNKPALSSEQQSEPAAEAVAEKNAEKKKGEGTQLYGGIPLDKIAELFGLPQPIKGAKEALADVKALREEGTGVKKDARSMVRQLYDTVFASAHDVIKEAGDRYKSPTLTKLAKQIYAVAGKADAERSYFEAQNRVQARINEVAKLLKQAKELGATDKQLEAQIRNPASRQGALGRIADGIAKLLKEERAYMNEAAGHEAIADRGPGYLPANYNAQKIHNNKEAFIQDAAGAYFQRLAKDRDASTSDADLEAEARRRAEAFWYRKVFGDEGRPGVDTKPTKEKFTKERSFDEDAYLEDKLGKYLKDDLPDTLFGYLHRAGKWAEVSRRWGENWSKWPDMEAQMKAEGVPPEVIEQTRGLTDTIINGAQNDIPAWGRNFLSGLHAAQSIGLLEKSTMSSLAETLMPIVRSNGDLRVAAYTMLGVVKDSLFKFSKMSEHNQSLTELFDFSERLGAIGMMDLNNMLYDRFTSAEDLGKWTGKVMDRFYKGIQMTQLTNRNISRGVGAASVFIDSLSRQALNGRKDAKVYLRELGVPQGQEQEFANYVRGLNQKLPNLPDYGKGTKMEEAYRTALLRFVDQTTMRPNRSTRPSWMSSPLGRVVGAIQSFNHAFHKNVLMRAARNVKTAATEADLGAFERLRMAGGVLPGLALMTLMQGMIWGFRDKLFSDREKTVGARVETAVSGTGLLGKFDPWVQTFSGVRYGRGVEQASLGPVVGKIAEAANAFLGVTAHNSEKTNTAERQAAKATYQTVLEPALQVGAGYLFPQAGGLAQFLTRSVAIPKGQEPFMTAVAGEKKKKDQKPIKGMVETFLEDKPASAGGRGSSRGGGRGASRGGRQSGR